MIIVEKSDPRDPQAVALLEQSHALMESLFPAEDNHFLSIDALCAPSITFLIAREGGVTLGTGALANKGTYGELKSMFVSPEARGKGVAQALLRGLEDTARDAALPLLKLETGNLLYAAHRLYDAAGFETCDPFGDYEANDSSLFYEKAL